MARQPDGWHWWLVHQCKRSHINSTGASHQWHPAGDLGFEANPRHPALDIGDPGYQLTDWFFAFGLGGDMPIAGHWKRN